MTSSAQILTLPADPAADAVAPRATNAVFLSYASEDAVPADRICSSLRSAGIQVWFDRSELRGGEEWDACIRRQIGACALFMPIMSVNSYGRAEGYFRHEWQLAVDRARTLETPSTFIAPVAIDGTPDCDHRVPMHLREVEWMRLPNGKAPPAFAERVIELLRIAR